MHKNKITYMNKHQFVVKVSISHIVTLYIRIRTYEDIYMRAGTWN